MSWQKQSCNWWRSIRQLSVSGKFVRRSKKKINITINVYCKYCTYKVSYVVKYSRYNKKETKNRAGRYTARYQTCATEMASSQPLPAAAAKPASLPTVTFPAPFTHTLPQNTAGKANVRGNQRALPVISPVPLPIQPTTQMLMLPHNPVLMVPPHQQQHPQVAVPSSSSRQSRRTYYYCFLATQAFI